MENPENIKDVKVEYPIAMVTITTVVTVDGTPVMCEAQEVFNLKQLGDEGIRREFGKMLCGFRSYLKKVRATKITPEMKEELLKKATGN